MFCKYCGETLTGSVCSKCGKEVLLINRSNELDRLMGVVMPPEKTYEQGLKDGYDNGYKEGYHKGTELGYERGYKEGEQKAKKQNKKQIILVWSLSLLLIGLASGGIGYILGKPVANKEEQETVEPIVNQSFSPETSIPLLPTVTSIIEQQTYKPSEKPFADEPTEAPTESQTDIPTSNVPTGAPAQGSTEIPPTDVPTEEPVDSPTEGTATHIPIIDNTPFLAQTEIICSKTINSGSFSNRSETVKSIQKKLDQLGYLKDKVDGIFGQKTEEAVKRFQTDMELPATGEVTRETYDLLFPDIPSEEPDVKPTDAITMDNGIIAVSPLEGNTVVK